MKKKMKTKMSCMRGVCWRKAENEHWQEVTSQRSKLKKKKVGS